MKKGAAFITLAMSLSLLISTYSAETGQAPVAARSTVDIGNRSLTQDANRLQVQKIPVTLEERQQMVADFIASSYVTNLPGATEGGFLITLPSGETKGGKPRVDLKYTCWVQNNALYAMIALQPFYPEIARELQRSYNYYYTNTFSAYSDQTQHWLTVGILPDIQAPPSGKYYRSTPVLITLDENGPEDEPVVVGTEIHDGTLGAIPNDDPRILFKYGVLQNHLAGNTAAAITNFRQALTLWSADNQGFVHPRTAEHGTYYARDLAYALICDNAVSGILPAELRNIIQNRLWSICWDASTGGVWTNYNPDGTIPPFAKQTHEISSLTLLAYRSDIWQGVHHAGAAQ